MLRTTSFVLALTCALLPSGARAASPDAPETRDAAQLFRAGQAAYDHGDHEAAARAFEEAYRRAPRAAAAYNAGRAWQASHSPARAADAYALALRDDVSFADLRPEQRAQAQSALAALRREVAELTIAEPAGARLDVGYVEARTIPTTIYLLPGRHSLRLSSGAREAFHEVTVTAGERHTLTFAALPAPAPPAPAPPPDLAATAPAVVPPPPGPSGARDPWAWITGGLAIAAGASAAVLALRFSDKNDAYAASGYMDRELHDDALRLRTYTNVAIGTAAVFAAISAWRFLRHPSESRVAVAGGALLVGEAF